MSNFNDPNDGEVYREVDEVVVEEPTTYRVDPTYQSVETYVAPVQETRSFWSRFWWLIPLLALLIALPFALRGCNRQQCSFVPDSVFDNAAQTTAVNTLEQWIPGIAADHNANAVTALRELCNARLSHTGGGNWYDNDRIGTAFNFIEGGVSETVVGEIRSLVEGNTFCRCS